MVAEAHQQLVESRVWQASEEEEDSISGSLGFDKSLVVGRRWT